MFGQQDNNAPIGPLSGMPGSDPTATSMPDPLGLPSNSGMMVPDNTMGQSPMPPGLSPLPPPPSPMSPDMPPAPAGGDDLLNLKQQALQQLSPLVSQLEQSPEEKFRTTMMMIQASDNQGLIKDAFEAAKKITDDKTRAQALLDVINEINYFTQQQQQ